MNRNQRISEFIRQNAKLVVSDDFEITVIDKETTRAGYVNGECCDTGRKLQTWITLRLIQRKSPGIAIISGDSRDSLQQVVESASRAADASKVDPWFRFPLWRSQAVQFKDELLPLTTEEEEEILAPRYPLFSKKPYAFIERHEVETEHVTIFRKQERHFLSKGRRLFQMGVNLSLGEGAQWFRDEKRSTKHSLEEQKGTLAELLGTALQSSTAALYDGPSPQRYVLGPRVAAFILKENEKAFVSKLHKTEDLFTENISEALTLIDDGTVAGLPESSVFDMEGSLMEKTVLFEAGIFKTLLHNTHTATKENRLSTGNAVLALDQKQSSVGFTNFYIDRGKEPELISALGDGFVLNRIEAIERKGEEFRLWLAGFKVREGKFIESVRQVPLDISLMQFLRTAKRVGQDLEFFGNIGSPSILFEKNP